MSILGKTAANLLVLVDASSGLFRLGQTHIDMATGMIRLAQPQTNLFSLVQTCSDLLKLAQTCSVLL